MKVAKLKALTVLVVAVVTVIGAVGFAWSAPCPCDSVRKTVVKPVRKKARPILASAFVPSAFAQSRIEPKVGPKVRVDTVVVYRDRFHEVVRPARESWWSRNDRWLIPAVGLVGGIIGWNLRGDEGDDRVIVVGGGGDDGHDDGFGWCEPHHPRGKHGGWQGHK